MAYVNEADLTQEERRERQDRRERLVSQVLERHRGFPVEMKDVVAEAEEALRYIEEGKANG